MSLPPDDRISAYLDGELDADGRRSVDDELAASPEWRAELEAVAHVRETLRRLPVREAPPGFWERVLGSADELAAVRAKPKRRRVARWGATTAAAAAIVAAVFAVPRAHQVSPPVTKLSDSHAVRQSESDDPVSSLATLSLVAPFRR